MAPMLGRSLVPLVALLPLGCCSALVGVDPARLNPPPDGGGMDSPFDAAIDPIVSEAPDDGNACACPAGTTCCNGSTCVDLATNPENCGSCGRRCTAAGAFCSGGTCVCPDGLTECAGACVDTNTDWSNCGVCSNVCPSGSPCAAGHCSCPMGATSCGSTCVDAQFDLSNCGRCGNACATAQICAWGSCICDPRVSLVPFGDCTNRNTDPNACGWSRQVCGGTTPVCDAGSCRAACTTGGVTNCDGACTNLTEDPYNCGACGNVCPGTTVCGAGCCREMRVPAGCGIDPAGVCPRPTCTCPTGFSRQCVTGGGTNLTVCIGPCR